MASSEVGDESDLDDLKAFIIPPPPSTASGGGSNRNSGASTVTSSSTTVRESSVGSSSTVSASSTDRDVQEVRVPPVLARGDRDKISPKIASIQQRLMSPTSEEANPDQDKTTASSTFRNMQDTLSRNSRKSLTQHDSSSSFPPPPPPPRSIVSRSAILAAGRDRAPAAGIPSYEFGQERPKVLPLKTSTTGDKTSPGSSTTPPTSNGGGGHGVKMSLTSSSDSLSSTTSVNTVKSVSPTKEREAEEEAPPSLPPR